MFVLFLNLAESLQNAVDFVGLFGILHCSLEMLEFMVQMSDAAAPRDRLIEDGSTFHFFNILAEITYCEFLGNRDFAFVRGFVADDHPEKRRLARAVRAH